MSDGMQFVAAGYGLTIVVIAFYAFRVWRRLGRARSRMEELQAEARAPSPPGRAASDDGSSARRTATPIPREPAGASTGGGGEAADG